MEKLRVMIVDDEVDYANEIAEFLESQDYRVFIANLPSEAFNLIQQETIDLIVLDIKLPEMDGLEVLEKIKKDNPEIEVIMITGHGDMESVITSFRLGALDYINKPFGAFEIKSSIERSKRFINLNLDYKEIKESYDAATNELKHIFAHEIVGNSNIMKKAINLMSKVANTNDTSVLITGESGTGKELIARGIHYLSDRKDKYFYDVNCSAIPESLFESEFFGHTKGAFTGATEDKPGWFEIANKGTLFLDEIGDMPLNQQIKLLRVLEQRTIRRIGSPKEIVVDLRIIAATNQNLQQLVEEKKFRLDLFHRLNSFVIHVPPLRERKSDIPLLLDFYVRELSRKMRKDVKRIDDKVRIKLKDYIFPGNVRELKNMVEKAMIITTSDVLKLNDFAFNPVEKNKNNVIIFDLEKIEKNTILEVMNTTRFKSKAAKMLNITPQSLDRRLVKHNIKI